MEPINHNDLTKHLHKFTIFSLLIAPLQSWPEKMDIGIEVLLKTRFENISSKLQPCRLNGESNVNLEYTVSKLFWFQNEVPEKKLQHKCQKAQTIAVALK